MFRAFTGRDPRTNRCVYGQSSIILHDSLDQLTFPQGQAEIINHMKRKTKIVCTMGPSCWSVEKLVELIDEGMNVIRLNFSHGDHSTHQATLNRIKEALKLRPEASLGLLLDTKGPEIRTGFFQEGLTSLNLEAGKEIILTTDYSFKGNESKLAVSYPHIADGVKVGGLILIADGSLSLEVVEVLPKGEVRCKILNSAKIGERKNCNLPGVHVNLPVIGDKDKDDILNFCIPNNMNFVAASFVQSGNDVRMIRNLLGVHAKKIKIISKIENEEGLKNFEDILRESDGIMVARGDMGMEIPPEKVFLAQKMIIGKCNLAGKFVITATQMLESMIKSPRPTRAEASDVANAVLDGSDAVMLSGETANGDFPRNAVRIMRRICEEAESVIDYASLYLSVRQSVLQQSVNERLEVSESMCSSAVKTALDTHCKLIVCITDEGETGRLVSKYRSSLPVIAVTTQESTARALNVCRGIYPMIVASIDNVDQVFKSTCEIAKKKEIVNVGEKICVVYCNDKEPSNISSNVVRVITVE